MIIDPRPFSLKGDNLVHPLHRNNNSSEPVDNQPLEWPKLGGDIVNIGT